MLTALRYRTPPTIRWCQERARILVIDEAAGFSASLTGIDAAVWKWISLGYRQRELETLIQAFLNEPLDEAVTHLNQILNLWVEMGLLTLEVAAEPERSTK